MREKILIDTGPLVGLLNPDDDKHGEAAALFKAVAFPLYTCLPVISEAQWLLRRRADSLHHLFHACHSLAVQLLPIANDDMEPIWRIMQEYPAHRPDFADAALVHLARREKISSIATFDRRDFSAYLSYGNRHFRIVEG